MSLTTLTAAPPIQRRYPVVAPTLQVADAAAATVFRAVRQRGPVARDEITASSSLSTATVNRQVAALVGAGLLRDRTDLVAAGAVGRPRVPVEVNDKPFLTLGIHVGVTTTSIVAADLLGRTLDAVETPTPHGDQATALAALAGSVRGYLNRWRRRRPLWVGVAIGGIVDAGTGRVDHARLGWRRAPVGATFADALELPVSVASNVDAMAGAELLLDRRHPAPPTTSLYVYARETVGYALMINGRVHTPAGGPGTIAALPVGSELLGGSGELESTVSDAAVLAAARRLRILPPGGTMAALLHAARGGDQRATELLAERARVLGVAVALLRDLLNPDDLVVGGQAFTGYPEGMALVAEAFTARSVLPPRAIRVTAFGNRVQEAGAGVVSLSRLYADPITAIRRTA